MKFNKNRLGAIALSFLVLAASSFNAKAVQGDESTPQTTPFISVAIPSANAVWDAAEALGAEMKYLETVQGLREIAFNDGLLKTLDPSKPIEICLATDGNDVFVYGRLSLAEPVDASSVERLKEVIAERNADEVFDEVFIEGSTLVFCGSKYKSLVPIDAALPSFDYAQDAVFVVDFRAGAIPREFLEVAFAGLRQQLAEANANESEVALEDLEGVLTFYSEIIDSLEDFRYTLRVDAERNLVSTFTIVAKPEGELAQILEKSRDSQTRWNVVANMPNAVFAVANSQEQTDAIKKFQKNQLENVTYRNVLDQLDVLIDSPEDFEVAKKIVEAIKNEALATIESGTSDAGIAFGADPVLFDFAWSICKPKELRDALRLLVEHMIKNNPDVAKYVALETKTVEGYAVSEINLPIDDLGAQSPEYFKGKALTVRFGIDNGSAISVFGLNADDADAEFARIAKGSKDVEPASLRSSFDFAPLALLLHDIVSSEGSARPVALETLETIGSCKGARLTSEQRFSEKSVDVDLIVEKGFFNALGDVIRINLAAAISNGADVDEGEDLDDLFDEK